MNIDLVKLQEECAEVIHIVSKIHRFGIDEVHPVTKLSNDELLHKEVGDVLAIIERLKQQGILKEEILKIWKEFKLLKFEGSTNPDNTKPEDNGGLARFTL